MAKTYTISKGEIDRIEELRKKTKISRLTNGCTL